MEKISAFLIALMVIAVSFFSGCNKENKSIDTDGDGYNDETDAFPNNASEWIDSDNDSVGDNTDYFPNDKTKWMDIDSDGDGLNDTLDAFPYNTNEQNDNDNDGVGDNTDLDDDNDGFEDLVDFYQFKNAKIKISLLTYSIWDIVDYGNDTNDAEIYFEISVNNNTVAYAPSENNYWRTLMKDTANCNWNFIYDIPDNIMVQTVEIRMYDLDNQSLVNVSEQLDIDSHDESLECKINYNIISNKWDGDDNDGRTDGNDDGIQNDAPNAYLRYYIDTKLEYPS